VVDSLLAQVADVAHLGGGRVADARERLIEFTKEAGARPGDDASGAHAAVGPVAATLVRLARETGAAIIVAGARGHGARAQWIGSTTTRLLRESDRAVLVVPGGYEPSAVDRVVCGVDFSEASDAACLRAASLARQLRVPLLLLHAVIAPDEPSMLSTLAVGLVTDRLHQKRALLIRSGPSTIEVLADVGEPAGTIIRHAAGRTWIVLGLGTDDPAARPGTIAQRVLTTAQVPVLAVPAERERRHSADSAG
jgi:nucleotide-binding universal stress UspA family protein